MERLLINIKISVNEKIYLKDPESSDLGKRILKHSIELIHSIGFECFNFKKLGKEIGSNESSIYRYFENKHKLLLYLTSWYWGWLEYKLVFSTNGISNPKNQLIKAIEIICDVIREDSRFSHINEVKLSKILIAEYSKSYLTKEVDDENKEGYFSIYKRLIIRIKEMIGQVNPKYQYPASLASSIVEGALHQHFLREHFPLITDCSDTKTTTSFYSDLVLKTIQK
ncbi:TetR/AcrR family transcriptional regulator [Aquimarina agarilytica]|uniref:TetR/AcrR family transcriptional regulator n=1 Tax=Aquimarina agarilytica TaxID=1087449 RepID=UPI000289298A|nr:TetR/AcrR family transcriptional regulator [Aquimarina agarilytica]